MRRVWVCVIVIVLLAPALLSPAGAAPGGRTLVMAVGGTTPTLNPHAAASTPAVAVFLQMFEGLTRFNAQGKEVMVA